MRLNGLMATCALTIAACDCRPPADVPPFACDSDHACATGYHCMNGVCTLPSATAGGTATGGGTDTGGGIEGTGGGSSGGGTGGTGGMGGGTGGAAGGTAGGTAGGGTAGGNAADGLKLFDQAPAPLLAGACFAAKAEAQLNGSPLALVSPAQVLLSVQPAAGVAFYADSSCTQSISAVTIAAMQSAAQFFVRAVTGSSGVVITGTAPFGSAMLTFNILPAVRRGTCTLSGPLPDGGRVLTVDCAISPPQQDPTRTLALFTTTGPPLQPSSYMLRCRLTSASTLTCDRYAGGAAMFVSWQTLELPAGLTVQRVQGGCSGPPMSLTLSSPVPAASSFVLRSTTVNSANLDDDEALVGRLTSATGLELDFGTAGSNCTMGSFEAQVTTLTGVTVTHGQVDAGMAVRQGTVAVTGLPAASANAAVLVQARVQPDTHSLCASQVRAYLPAPDAIGFSRGLSDGGCALDPLLQLDWQRLDFGARARVIERTVTLQVNDLAVDVTVPAVDVTRALVLGSSMADGVGTGETDYDFDASFPISETAARLDLTSATTVHVERNRAARPASFTFYVLELNP
jgi:hypothetical protein